MTVEHHDWRAAASDLAIESRAFIDGDYRASLSGKTRALMNPADGTTLADVAECGVDDVEQAVAVARRAFEGGSWSRMAPGERKAIMVRWAELMEQHATELALLETLDAGKPISDTTGDDVPSAIRTIRWSGEAIDKLYDEISPSPSNTLALVQRLPLGVVGAVVPFNFPISTTAWKLGPALATGNSVIVKPSENTPLTALRMAGLAVEAGLPAGVLQVLPGDGPTVGAQLARHPGVDGVTFTGSTATGKRIMQDAAQSNLKRVFLELGGKSPNIVFADANLDKAAAGAALAVFFNGGQTCTAGTRLFVERSAHEVFMEKLLAHCQAWRPGDPLDPDTAMGPLISEKQFQTVSRYVAVGQEEGASLLTGGAQAHADSGGYYYEPTIFTGVRNDMRIAREEIFGPVLSVIDFDSVDEAIALANDSIYGLAGAVWTSNINKAHKVADALRVGTMTVNNYFGGDITVPFGGFKQSGNGRDKSIHAFHDYTELKTTWFEFDD